MFRLDQVLWGGLLVLTAGACQRETTARTEPAAPAVATVAADTALPDAPLAPAAPRRDWHRLTRRTNPHAPLIRYRAVARPAAALPSTPPAEARLFDLTLKASEFFRIDPTQPAEVRGREGTVVRLPALALLDARQRPVQEPVWLELKECLGLADLLLSDCVSTGPGGEAMQTGGVLLVRATTGKGQALRLAPGSALEVQLPEEQRAPGRQLYHSNDRRQWAALPLEAAPESGPAYAQASTAGSSIIDAVAESSATEAAPSPALDAADPTLLRSPELGWLTCLRSWPPAGEATLLVPTEIDEHTSVRLVFPEAGVILAGTPHAAGYVFEGLPAHQRAVLVGLRYFNGSAYVAVQPVAPGQEPAPLEFREATLGEIEEQLQALR
ncbi:hypothetical protein [Hymenobacter coalescens]